MRRLSVVLVLVDERYGTFGWPGVLLVRLAGTVTIRKHTGYSFSDIPVAIAFFI